MYKILKAEQLTANIFLMDVEAPRVARHCEPGQFVIVKMDEKGERIPLTICDYDREAGTITIVFQPVGASTTKMKELKAGDYFRDFTGPLGNASELVEEDIEELKKKKILFVGGGVGAAPVYPQVKWLHEHGVDADVIIGSKTKDMLILEKEMEAVSGNYYPCTDDGSYGHAGMVTTMVEELVEKKFIKKIVLLLTMIMAFTVICVMGAYIVGIPVLSLISGCDLHAYRKLLIILMIAGGINSASFFMYYILTIMRNAKSILIGYITSAVITAVISNKFVEMKGLEGAAFSFLVTVIYLFLYFMISFVRKMIKRSKNHGRVGN